LGILLSHILQAADPLLDHLQLELHMLAAGSDSFIRTRRMRRIRLDSSTDKVEELSAPEVLPFLP